LGLLAVRAAVRLAAVLVGRFAVFVRRRGVFLRLVVAAVFVMVRRLAMMVRCGLVVRSCVVMMFR